MIRVISLLSRRPFLDAFLASYYFVRAHLPNSIIQYCISEESRSKADNSSFFSVLTGVYFDRDKVKIVKFTLTYNFLRILFTFRSEALIRQQVSVAESRVFRVTIESRKQGRGDLENSNSSFQASCESKHKEHCMWWRSIRKAMMGFNFLPALTLRPSPPWRFDFLERFCLSNYNAAPLFQQCKGR